MKEEDQFVAERLQVGPRDDLGTDGDVWESTGTKVPSTSYHQLNAVVNQVPYTSTLECRRCKRFLTFLVDMKSSSEQIRLLVSTVSDFSCSVAILMRAANGR